MHGAVTSVDGSATNKDVNAPPVLLDQAANDPADPIPGTRKCPICGKPAAERFRPFCSKRCADVDLHRWFSGRYAVPAAEQEAEEGAPPEDEHEG